MMGPLLFTQVFAVALRADGPLHVPGAPYLLAALMITMALYIAVRATRRLLHATRVEQSNA